MPHEGLRRRKFEKEMLLRIFLLIALSVTASVAQAQSSPIQPAGSPPSWVTRDPLALPGDNLPPSLNFVVGPPPTIAANAPRAEILSPPLAKALEAAQAALAQCKADGFAVGVAVSNSVGGMILGIQAEGAFPGRVYNAARKNLVAIEFGLASSVVRDKLRKSDFATLSRTRPNMTLLPGALPVYTDDGVLIGAIAVSGAPASERDEICALAGADRLKK